jgi:uncharacterized phiE125 gp8 family phage protein
MNLFQVQAPMTDVVDLTTAKNALRIDTSADDARVMDLVRAATHLLEGAGGSDGILGRALMPQTWRLEMPDWPGDYEILELPMPPLIAVTSVIYLDTNGAEQTLASTVYRTRITAGRGQFMLADDQTWPTAMNDYPDAIRITFDCGYQDAASPSSNPIPECIRQAILVLAQSMYDRPGEDIPEAVYSLIRPFRVGALGAI